MGTNAPPETIQLGYRYAHGNAVPFYLSTTDRRQHLYLIGKTGTGKSTLLRNLIMQDIFAGRGIALIDPHGDLAESVLDLIPSWRSEDVVYFDPADVRFQHARQGLRLKLSPQIWIMTCGSASAAITRETRWTSSLYLKG